MGELLPRPGVDGMANGGREHPWTQHANDLDLGLAQAAGEGEELAAEHLAGSDVKPGAALTDHTRCTGGAHLDGQERLVLLRLQSGLVQEREVRADEGTARGEDAVGLEVAHHRLAIVGNSPLQPLDSRDGTAVTGKAGEHGSPLNQQALLLIAVQQREVPPPGCEDPHIGSAPRVGNHSDLTVAPPRRQKPDAAQVRGRLLARVDALDRGDHLLFGALALVVATLWLPRMPGHAHCRRVWVAHLVTGPRRDVQTVTAEVGFTEPAVASRWLGDDEGDGHRHPLLDRSAGDGDNRDATSCPEESQCHGRTERGGPGCEDANHQSAGDQYDEQLTESGTEEDPATLQRPEHVVRAHATWLSSRDPSVGAADVDVPDPLEEPPPCGMAAVDAAGGGGGGAAAPPPVWRNDAARCAGA